MNKSFVTAALGLPPLTNLSKKQIGNLNKTLASPTSTQLNSSETMRQTARNRSKFSKTILLNSPVMTSDVGLLSDGFKSKLSSPVHKRSQTVIDVKPAPPTTKPFKEARDDH